MDVWANDSVGGVSHAETNLTVAPAPSAAAAGEVAPSTYWIALAGLVGLGVLGAIAVVMLGRRRN